jgi:hypothetical protein
VECGLFQKNVNADVHLHSEDCKKYAEIKRNMRVDEYNKAAINVNFEVKGEKINIVKQFKYLGRIIDDNDNDLAAVEAQLKKARMTWGRIGKILKKKTNSNPKIMSIFYKVIIQSVLLYGSESWVLNNLAKEKLQSFHHRCARYITGRHIRKEEEIWIYPDNKTTLELADLLPIEEYIKKRKETILIFARDIPIFQQCNTSQYMRRHNNSLVWWDKNQIKSVLEVAEISNT